MFMSLQGRSSFWETLNFFFHFCNTGVEVWSHIMSSKNIILVRTYCGTVSVRINALDLSLFILTIVRIIP